MKNKSLRLISTSLVLIIIISLVGCQEIKAPQVEPTQVIIDEPSAITFAFRGMTESSSDMNSVSPIIKDMLLEQFNIDIKPLTFSQENWKDELAWMISVNQIPDVFYHDIIEDKIQFRQMLDLGQLRPVSKGVWAQFENLSKVMSWYEKVYSIDDEMYFVPRTIQTFDQTHGSSSVILYRKDWAKKTNSTLSEDIKFTDIVKMYESFIYNDPNANSIKDTWGITGADGFQFIKNGFLIPFGVRDWMYEDDKWIPGLISSNAKEATAWAIQLYRDGAIDSDITQINQEFAMSKFITGKAGAIVTDVYPQQVENIEKSWAQFNPDLDINNAVGIIPSYATPSGKHYNELDTFYTGTLFSANLNDNDLRKVLKFFDYIYSQQGRIYMEYGRKDVDYIDDNGIISTRINNDNGESIKFSDLNIQLSSLETMVSWNMDLLDFEKTSASVFQTACQTALQEDVWPWSYEDIMFTDGMFTPEVTIFNIERVAGDKLLNIILTVNDFDTAWDEYVQYCYNELNIEQAAIEVEQRAKELNEAIN